jgi:hypothetical protein
VGYVIRSKSRFLIVFAVLTVFQLLVCANIIKAETWSWVTSKPIVAALNTVKDIAPTSCYDPYQLKKIAGESDPQKVCVTSDSDIKFGTYHAGGFISVIGFAYDDKMYKLNGLCDWYDSCLYLPNSDMLVTKGGDLIHRSLVIYKNFLSRLTQTTNPSNLATEYNFDASNPDYTFQSASGYVWPIGGLGVSENGRWLAIELRSRGVGLFDIETMQMKRISPIMTPHYGTGADPELAVSNDGRHIAVMGMNSGLTVFEVNSDCGDTATDYNMPLMEPIAQPCPTSPIDIGEFVYRLVTAMHPRFDDNGGELDFYVTSYSGDLREVTLRAAGYGGQRLDYLALGD